VKKIEANGKISLSLKDVKYLPKEEVEDKQKRERR